jgi:hypothetical protein
LFLTGIVVDVIFYVFYVYYVQYMSPLCMEFSRSYQQQSLGAQEPNVASTTIGGATAKQLL